jgi:hypothetical protein
VTFIVSSWEALGSRTQCMRKSRSRKVGSRSCPSRGTTAMPAAKRAATTRYAASGRRTTGLSIDV